LNWIGMFFLVVLHSDVWTIRKASILLRNFFLSHSKLMLIKGLNWVFECWN
jgi:hypothetical protein